MNPTDYERYVASLLIAEGWDASVTPPSHDFGLDVICKRAPDRRLGVQVKMYGSGRAVNAQMIMQLYGAARFADCPEAMMATDGRVLDDARLVARKLGIEIRQVPIPTHPSVGDNIDVASGSRSSLSFDSVWKDYVIPLAGQEIRAPDGRSNKILSVDWSGLTRRTSTGHVGTIDIEIFRWTVDRLLRGEQVLRTEINDQYPKRASSGVVLILGSLPIFTTTSVDRKLALRAVGSGQ